VDALAAAVLLQHFMEARRGDRFLVEEVER
jgi:hypothetical protein